MPPRFALPSCSPASGRLTLILSGALRKYYASLAFSTRITRAERPGGSALGSGVVTGAGLRQVLNDSIPVTESGIGDGQRYALTTNNPAFVELVAAGPIRELVVDSDIGGSTAPSYSNARFRLRDCGEHSTGENCSQ